MVQSGNIVRKATSDDPEPTPGYLFIEMASLSSFHSSPLESSLSLSLSVCVHLIFSHFCVSSVCCGEQT